MAVITVTPTVEPGTGLGDPPRVRLDVSDTGTPTVTSVTITRLDPDGRLRPVRTSDGRKLTLSGGSGLLYDYEAPFGQGVFYSSAESPTVGSSQVTVPESRVWMIHPGIPSLSTPITVASIGNRTRTVTQGVFWPMARSSAVVVTDGRRKAGEYELRLFTNTDDERRALEALFYDASSLLLNVPAQLGWGVASEYVALGDLTEERLGRWAGNPMRTWTLTCTVVDMPVGGSQAERTYTDLLVIPSYSQLAGIYATYLDLLAGP